MAWIPLCRPCRTDEWFLQHAHRYGFTLDVVTVKDIAGSADSKLFKSITHSNHCLHFLLPLLRIKYTLSGLKVIHISFPPTKLNYIEDRSFLVIFFVLCIRSVNIPNLFHCLVACVFVYYTVFIFFFLFIYNFMILFSLV